MRTPPSKEELDRAFRENTTLRVCQWVYPICIGIVAIALLVALGNALFVRKFWGALPADLIGWVALPAFIVGVATLNVVRVSLWLYIRRLRQGHT